MNIKNLKSTATRLSALLAAGILVLNANAQTISTTNTRSRFSLGAEGGTTGFGPVLNYAASPKLNFSLSYNLLEASFDVDGSKSRYDGSLDLSTVAAIANWRPASGRFHVSAGAILVDHKITITGKPKNGTTYEIGDHSYSNSQLASLTGRIKTDSSLAPYLGFGWSWDLGDSGFSIISNFGVMFINSYDAKLTATGPTVTDPAFIADLRKEEKAIADDLTVYPVVKIGFAYRF